MAKDINQNAVGGNEIDPAMAQKMNQPIDPDGTYSIPGGALVQLYAELDEVPMKYARRILPLVAMNIERIDAD